MTAEVEQECDVYCQLFDRLITNEEDEFLNDYLSQDYDDVCVAMELEPYPSLVIDDMQGYRVKKIVTARQSCIDLTKLDKYNVRVYMMDHKAWNVGYQKYYVYVGREMVVEYPCPPAIHRLADAMLKHVWGKSYMLRGTKKPHKTRYYDEDK